jgi:hypothetical protein
MLLIYAQPVQIAMFVLVYICGREDRPIVSYQVYGWFLTSKGSNSATKRDPDSLTESVHGVSRRDGWAFSPGRWLSSASQWFVSKVSGGSLVESACVAGCVQSKCVAT